MATAHEIVYLVAPSGHPNYGDELILRAWLRYLAQVRPGADVVVDCHTPGQAAVLHRGTHPNLTFVDTAWRIAVVAGERPDPIEFAQRVVGDPGVMSAIVSGVELLASANTVHLVGGGYVNAVWPHHLNLLAVATAAVERSGGRAVATGQGLVPGGSAERVDRLRALCNRFDVFDARDAESADLVDATSGTGDDAWLGLADPDVYDGTGPAAARPFVFCLQADLMDGFGGESGVDGLVVLISNLLSEWDLRGSDVAFVECIPGADRIVYDRVRQQLPGNLFVPFTDIWWHGMPACAGQTWVSTRFHPHLVAAAKGACGVALTGRADYYPVKHRSLIELGSRWTAHAGTDVPDRPARGAGFDARTVAAALAHKRSLAEAIYPPRRFRVTRGRASPRPGARWAPSR